MVGGGVVIYSGSTATNINSSWPFNNSTWRGFANNATGAAINFSVYAVCVNAL